MILMPWRRIGMPFVLVATLLMCSASAFARHTGSRNGTGTRSAHSGGARPYYGGGHHTASHGGHYQGETNSVTHKGGHYTNPRTGNRYGRHK